MTLAETINNDLQSIFKDLGEQTITWNSEEYDCVPSGQGSGATLEEGGFALDADFICNVRLELFTDDILPKPQQKISFKSKDYRIITTRVDATNTFIKLSCQSANRGI